MSFSHTTRRRTNRRVAVWGLSLLLLATGAARAADAPPELVEGQKLYDAGKYEDCITMATKALVKSPTPVTGGSALDALLTPDTDLSGWWVLKARAQLQLGKYDDAGRTTQAGLADYSENVPLYLLRRQALLFTGKETDAKALMAKVDDVVSSTPWRLTDVSNRVGIGQFMLLKGTDARQVLENYYDRARRDEPRSPVVLLAIGDLALAKNDPGVASEAYETAMRITPVTVIWR